MGRQLTVTLPDDVADAVDRAVAEQGWRDAGEYIAEAVRGWREPFTPDEIAALTRMSEEAEAEDPVGRDADEVFAELHAIIEERAAAHFRA